MSNTTLKASDYYVDLDSGIRGWTCLPKALLGQPRLGIQTAGSPWWRYVIAGEVHDCAEYWKDYVRALLKGDQA